MAESDRKITWENFERYCNGISIHTRFAVLCSRLLGMSFNVSPEPDFTYVNIFHFDYNSSGYVTTCYLSQVLNDKEAQELAFHLFFRFAEDCNRAQYIFYFNKNDNRIINLLSNYFEKSNLPNPVFVCDQDILNLVENSSSSLKNYFFGDPGISQKWFYYHVKDTLDSYSIPGTVCEEEIRRIQKTDRLHMEGDECRTIGELLNRFVSKNDRYLWIDSVTDQWASLHFARSLAENGGICIHVDTDRFNPYGSLPGQIADEIGLGISFECFIDYTEYYSAEHDCQLVFIMRGRKPPTLLHSFLEAGTKWKHVKFVFFYPGYHFDMQDIPVIYSSECVHADEETMNAWKHERIKEYGLSIYHSSLKYGLPIAYIKRILETTNPVEDESYVYEEFMRLKCKEFSFVYLKAIGLDSANPVNWKKATSLFYSGIMEIAEEIWKNNPDGVSKDTIKTDSEIGTLDSYDTFIQAMIQIDLLSINSDDLISVNYVKSYLIARSIFMRLRDSDNLLQNLSDNFQSCITGECGIISLEVSLWLMTFYAYEQKKEFVEDFITYYKAHEQDEEKRENCLSILRDYIKSLTRRRKIFVSLKELYHSLMKFDKESLNILFDIVLDNFADATSPFNSLEFSRALRSVTLRERDDTWTQYIQSTRKDRFKALLDEIDFDLHSLRFSHSREKKMLLVFLECALTSSIRTVRDFVSYQMISLLENEPMLCMDLLSECNDDPYVVERVYQIIYGTMKRSNEIIKENHYFIVDTVYRKVFRHSYKANQRYMIVYPDIVVRDAAYSIIEDFLRKYPRYKDYFKDYTPPYTSGKISELNCKNNWFEYLDENSKTIIDSLSHIMYNGISEPYWGCMTFRNSLPENIVRNDEAKRKILDYCLHLVFEEFGYGPGSNHNERALQHHSSCEKLDYTLGDKYQWIAYNEALARIYDEYGINPYEKNKILSPSAFKTFDPTRSMYETSNPVIQNLTAEKKKLFDDLSITVTKTLDSLSLNHSEQWRESFDEKRFLRNMLDYHDKDGNEYTNLYYRYVNHLFNGKVSFFIEITAVFLTPEQVNQLQSYMDRGIKFTCYELSTVSSYPFNISLRDILSRKSLDKVEFPTVHIVSCSPVVLGKGESDQLGNVIGSVSRYQASTDAPALLLPRSGIRNDLKLSLDDSSDNIWNKDGKMAGFCYHLPASENEGFVMKNELVEEYEKYSQRKLVWFIDVDKTVSGNYCRHFGFITKDDEYVFSVKDGK